MSQRISIKGIVLSELTKNFGSIDKDTLHRVAQLIQRESGGPLLNAAVTSIPEGVADYEYDSFIAARDIIRGEVKSGDSLPYESQAMVNAVEILSGLQDKPWAEMKHNGDWKNYAIDAYQEDVTECADQNTMQMLAYLSKGRPFFSHTFCKSYNFPPDEYYSYLTYQELQELAQYMRLHACMTSDGVGFGADLLSGVESLIILKKDLWCSVF